jgi:hypothetical protein
MKTSRLLLSVSTCLLVSWLAVAPRAEAGPLILANSWSHCYGGSGSVVTVTLDSLTASHYSSLTMYVDGVHVGTQSPTPSTAVTRRFYLNVSLAPGQHTFYLAVPGASSPSYNVQVTSGVYCSRAVPIESAVE